MGEGNWAPTEGFSRLGGYPHGLPGLPMAPNCRLPGGPCVRREVRRRGAIPPAGLRHQNENQKPKNQTKIKQNKKE